jgi:hypothetical protein
MEKTAQEELHDFYSSPNIIRVKKLDRNGILHKLKR